MHLQDGVPECGNDQQHNDYTSQRDLCRYTSFSSWNHLSNRVRAYRHSN